MFKKRLFSFLKNQSGQALLIIVLVMVVALTIGLSVASRTITNLRTSREQASSQKALSAAEAGVEQAIKNGVNVAGSLSGGDISYETTITSVSGTSAFLLNGTSQVPKDDPIYIWITPYSTNQADLWQSPYNGTLTLYWGNSSVACNNAALEVAVITGTRNNPTLKRYAYDPCSSRANNNRFDFSSVTATPTNISGKTLYYKVSLPAISNGLLVRVYPLYFSSFIGVSGSSALPDQGKIITSTGTADNSVQRKVTVFQGYPELPAELFPYILFSP